LITMSGMNAPAVTATKPVSSAYSMKSSQPANIGMIKFQTVSPQGLTSRSISKDQFQTELQLPHVNSKARVGDLTEKTGTRYRDAIGISSVGAHISVWVAKVGVIGAVKAFEPE